jgi:2-polyprenyl-6-methoxyphenol hydroxylase-like FAD-dependent oxidoreductase
MSFGVPAPDALQAISPSTVAICPQDHLEAVLLKHLLSQRGEVRFRTELVSLSMAGGGVTARLHQRPRHREGATDHAIYDVRARFLIGADGSTSAVRAALGIGVEQLGFEGEHLTILFQADLMSVIAGPAHALHFVTAPGAEGMFVPCGIGGRWVYDREWHPEHGESLTDWTTERCVHAIRAGAGVPHLTPQILRIFPWSFGAAVATALRAGNGFLVGDAAHRTTPRGAKGMNTAIAAAHNLGWKLAWVLRGWAGDALLDSYEEERRPVGLRNALRSLDTDDADDGEPLADDFGVVYSSSAIVPDGTDAPTPG